MEAVWSEFADREVRRTDGALLGYYRDGPCDGAGDITSAAGLLSGTNGQCGSWADLLVRCLRVQGVGSARFVRVDPLVTLEDCLPGNPDVHGFLVRSYSFAGSGQSGCTNYPYRINVPCAPAGAAGTWPAVDVADLNGVAGQDCTDPASFFNLHYIVKHDDRYFDPSYGTGPFGGTEEEAEAAWENSSIAGYFGFGLATHQGQPVYRPIARQDTTAREIDFTTP